MRTPLCTTLLCVWTGLLALGCASDVWFKPGAGPDALARDKATCRAQAVDAGEELGTFEACMEALDWWHAVPGTEGVALSEDAAYDESLAYEEPIGGAPEVAPEEPTPNVGAGPGARTALASHAEDTAAPSGAAPRARPRPRRAPRRAKPADPAKRQFWFKFGAGEARLAADQAECRTALGLAADADSPSRWGESADFDRCMRERGWTGGSVESP